MSPEDAESFERTLELGRQIAEDLSDSDVLGRWMAHHVSDLITRAETVTGQQAHDLGRETVDTIIRLWAHRGAAPLSSQPTAALQPVMQTMIRLGQDDRWGFYRIFPADSEPDNETTQTTLLRFAVELEKIVRDVVRHIVVVAAEQAADKEAKWLRLAEHLAEDEQRHLLRGIRLLDAADSDPADTDTADEDVPNRHTDSIAALRKAEKRLTEVRQTLESHFAAMTDDANGDCTS